jgi:hypothetical protein
MFSSAHIAISQALSLKSGIEVLESLSGLKVWMTLATWAKAARQVKQDA